MWKQSGTGGGVHCPNGVSQEQDTSFLQVLPAFLALSLAPSLCGGRGLPFSLFSLCEYIFLCGLKDPIFLMIPEFQSLGPTCLLSSSLSCPIADLIPLISMFQT